MTSVYTKPTDRNNLLRPTSYQPPGLFKGLPRSQLLWVRRIASTDYLYEEASAQMVDKFLSKGYNASSLEGHRQEVRSIPRQQLLKKSGFKSNKSLRTPFISSFDSNSLAYKKIILKYWGMLSTDPKHGQLFQNPSLFSYRRGRSGGECGS
ncbi:hypothetical protein XELAEV_18033259mg [Xenopus laevis]|uniref:Uncharacterized protein n=1 Tax=Xenopus laevis TaxID=8355 RepID=A0A974HDV1_XENLA|nr:hypothetical protein XELAEV_18033259mg [Xenopus laevis]